MKEWTSEFNPFNSIKVLTHFNNLKSIYEGVFLPPISVDIDPTNICNHKCYYCNNAYYRHNAPQNMPEGHLIAIGKFISNWGVKAVCIAGGGEPLINQELKDLLPLLKKEGIESGLITNGSLLNKEYCSILKECSKWVGISFEASCKETYFKIRGIDNFNKVLKNISELNKYSIHTTLKFLINPFNYREILDTAKIAKNIGCRSIQIRPIGIDNVLDKNGNILDKNFNMKDQIKEIKDQITACFELEDKNFNIFAVTHKFGENFEKVIKFKKCLATPLFGVFGADGNFYMCFDNRGKHKLGSHYPVISNILNLWGSKEHKELLKNINPNECMRCAASTYNQVFENCVINDLWFRNFL